MGHEAGASQTRSGAHPCSWQPREETKHLGAVCPPGQGALETPPPALSQAAPSPGCCFPLTPQLSEMNPGLCEALFPVAVVTRGAIRWKSRPMFSLSLQQLLSELFDEERQAESSGAAHTYVPFVIETSSDLLPVH